jgi:hypothetical protein
MADNEANIILSLKDEVSESIDKLGENFTESLLKMGLSVESAMKAWEALKGEITDSLKAFEEKQDVLVNTDRILAGLGKDATITADQIAKLSETISEHTGIEETWIQKGINGAILANNKLANGSDGAIDVLTQASIGLSRMTGEELGPTMESLARILDKPETAVTRLLRSGISLTDQQKDEIDMLIKLGDKAGAAAVILATLYEKTKDAQGAAFTLTEQLKATQAQVNKLQEDIGERLNPQILGAVKAKKAFFDILDKVIKFVPDYITQLTSIGGVYGNIVKLAASLAQKLGLVKKATDAHTDALHTNNAALDAANAKQAALAAEAKKRADAEIAREKKKADDELAINKKFISDKEKDAKTYEKKLVTDQKKLDSDLSGLANSWNKETELQTQTIQNDLVSIKRDAENNKKSIDDAAKAQAGMTNDNFEKEQILRHAEAEKKKIDDSVKGAEDRIKTAQMEHDRKIALETAVKDTLGELSQLQNSKNKDMFEIGKQASAANVIVKSAEAIMGFWASSSTLGPIAGPIFAGIETAAVVAVGAEQISQIESQSFPGAAGGAFAPGDGVTAKFGEKGNPEAILNEPQLKSIIRRAVNQGSQSQQISLVMDKSTMQNWSVKSTMQQHRLQKEGRLP